jgi:cell division protein FtsQ
MRRLNASALPRPAARARVRRAQPPSRLRRLLPYALGLGALLLAGASAWFYWPAAWIEARAAALEERLLAATAEAGLTLDRVTVTGRAETGRDTLLAAIGVKEGDPILAVDPEAIRARVEALPWVKTAVVGRSLAGTLALELAEFEPFALWQRHGKIMLIDRDGEAIDVAEPARFAELLLLVGDGAPEHAAALLDMLGSEPALKARVTAAVWVGDRRWNLHFDNGIDVKLPERHGDAAWRELARLERKDGLLQRDLVSIDMRMPDRLVVKFSPDAVERQSEPGSDT